MRVPWKWLCEYVELPWEPEEAARRFTLAGLKVESLGHTATHLSQDKADLRGVVSGKVLSVSPHPERGDLRVGLVDTGHERLSIVSGALSFEAGRTVLVAVPGASLPGGLRIEAKELGGVPSQGMVVCANEVLYGAPHRPGEDIITLPEGTRPGERAQDVLDLDDWVFEFELTVNYSHCLSVLGVAIEAAALSGSPLKLPRILESWDWAGPSGSRPPEGDGLYAGHIRVDLPDRDLCPRYVAKVIRGVSYAYSPVQMERRLMLAGMRPINAVVDATNYVMLETGQPLHAFDLDRLSGDVIWARRSREGETIVTLDGVSHDLEKGTLVIADGDGPVGVAGVMGGGRTEVTEATKNLLLESAYFAPVPIRITSQKLRLRTEAAQRFEKGVDPTAQAAVAERAAALIAGAVGGQVVVGRADLNQLFTKPKEMVLTDRDVRRTLGVPVSMDECSRIFQGLRFGVVRTTGLSTAGDKSSSAGTGTAGALTVIVPPRRVDIEATIDLTEEIARYYGYDRFREEPMPLAVQGGPMNRDFVRLERMKDFLVGMGGTEVVSTSLLNREDLLALGWGAGDPRGNPVRLVNPLTREESFLRTSLLPGLAKDLRANQAVRCPGGFFWETGRVFFSSTDELPLETTQLALASYGTLIPATWIEGERVASFYQMKGIVETLLSLLGIRDPVFVPKAGMPFHPGKSARIVVDASTAGEIGELHPVCHRDLGMTFVPIMAWLSLDVLLASANEASYVPVPRFMPVERDLAVIVSEEIPAGEVMAAVRATARDLQSVTLFDVYCGPPVPPGKKSLAMRLIYQPKERTLTEDDMSMDRQRVMQRLEKDFGARQRS